MSVLKWKLGEKLVAPCIGLVVVPLALIGGLSLRSVNELDRNVTGISTARLQADAEQTMDRIGKFRQTEATVEWDAVNQFSRERRQISLPAVSIGDIAISQNAEPGVATPLVDNIGRGAGGTATLFQRMNRGGDMLRVATSVIGLDGKRAIGTYIPAGNPDGKPNPVISAVLRKETFVGRAFAQINTGLSQIDQVTQQNTANAEETASASEQLSSMAEKLKTMISRFRLKEEFAAQIATDGRQTEKKRVGATHRVTLETGKVVRSQDVIALDDNDFGKY